MCTKYSSLLNFFSNSAIDNVNFVLTTYTKCHWLVRRSSATESNRIRRKKNALGMPDWVAYPNDPTPYP